MRKKDVGKDAVYERMTYLLINVKNNYYSSYVLLHNFQIIIIHLVVVCTLIETIVVQEILSESIERVDCIKEVKEKGVIVYNTSGSFSKFSE
jgi:hypothetical protein